MPSMGESAAWANHGRHRAGSRAPRCGAGGVDSHVPSPGSATAPAKPRQVLPASGFLGQSAKRACDCVKLFVGEGIENSFGSVLWRLVERDQFLPFEAIQHNRQSSSALRGAADTQDQVKLR